METPTITKNQVKKTLAGKKARKQVVKNVLATPFTKYRPLLSAVDNKHLLEILREHLPLIRPPEDSIPYKVIKTIPKAERKQFRLAQSGRDKQITANRDGLIFGVNDVSRATLNMELKAILIASDVKPYLLVQHIVDQAVLYSVPLLIVTDLRNVLKKTCGFSSATLGFTQTTNKELRLVIEAIEKLYENYPVPEAHVNFDRRLKLNEISVIEITDSDLTKSPSVLVISDSEDLEKNQPDSEDLGKNQAPLHLKRTSTTQRVFVPAKSRPEQKAKIIVPDFIPLSASEPAAVKKRKYKPLKVKRLQGDKNRNLRKLNTFKKKKKVQSHI